MLKARSLGSLTLYSLLRIGLVVLSRKCTGKSIDLTRSKFGDQFRNPLCQSDSCISNCERFNALCSCSECKYCQCGKDNTSMTYFPSNGSADGLCLRDLVIAQNSGCSYLYGGHLTHTLEENCGENCVEKVKIRSINISLSMKCVLWWNKSSFSINNQQWKTTESFENDFSLVHNNTSSIEELYMKINLEAYQRWSGALLKLKILCYALPSQPYYTEHVCVIFKFTGKYRSFQTPHTSAAMMMRSTRNATVEPRPHEKGIPRPGNQYLASTIALSGILFLVFLFLGIGIFLLLRRHDHHSPTAEHTMEAETVTTHFDGEEL